jgi:hypothetical protein
LTCLIFIYSCQSITRKGACFDNPDSASEASAFISELKTKNETVCAVKGIGKISLWDSNGIQKFRAAWIGSTDGRLRIEMLGLPGQPVAKFIYDGKKYYLISPLDAKSYQESCGDSDLKPLTGISISSEDVMLYLSGSIPLYECEDPVFQDGSQDCRNIISLKKNWHGVVEKIYLDDLRNHVAKVEKYHWGSLVYRVNLGFFQKMDGYEMPFLLNFSDGNKKGFGIEVERCWRDVPVKPEMFSIDPPERGE